MLQVAAAALASALSIAMTVAALVVTAVAILNGVHSLVSIIRKFRT